MSRISIPTVAASLAASQPLLAAVERQLGVVPNLMKLLGHSPAALEGYLSLNAALAKGSLPGALREAIALATAEFNGCNYCLAAHDYLGRNVARMSGAAIIQARAGHAADRRDDAALVFARRVLETRGKVADADLAALHSAGIEQAATLEIVAAVALNVLTNYVNSVAETDIDFPTVAALADQI